MWNRCDDRGVRGMAYFEQLREYLSKGYDLGRTVPVDCFIFGLGEPERPDVTKVGGLPYRPADQKWPMFEDCPMTFLAQFRFTESRDHIGETPGDVLLVFAKDRAIVNGDVPGTVKFEWQPLGLSNLVRPKDVPPPAWQFVTAHGVRHRTVNYPDRQTFDLIQRLVLAGQEVEREGQAYRQAFHFCCFAGTKIGGVCYWPYPDEVDPQTELPGRYLCTLGDVGPGVGENPWLNQAEPIESIEFLRRMDELTLNLWDGFLINFSIDDDDEMHWVIQKL